MRILLTGVTGQVGRALLRPLAQLGTVLAASRGELDLSKPETLGSMLDRLAPELIVNPAAYTAVDKAEDDLEFAHRVNAISPGVMAAWAASHAVPFVHFSTDYVFDGSGSRPWKEDDLPRPLGVYGQTKLAGERDIRAAAGAHLIIRTSWVYDAIGHNFLRTIIKLARERQELRIVADQVGAPTPAAVIADNVGAILAKHRSDLADAFRRGGGIVHLSCSGATSWYGFAVAIIDGLKGRGLPLQVNKVAPIQSSEYPARARRPLNSRLALDRIEAVYGIALPHWAEALAVELDVWLEGQRRTSLEASVEAPAATRHN